MAAPKAAPKAAPALPDLRKAPPRDAADGLTLLAYDAIKQVIVPVTLEAVLAARKPAQPDPSDDVPLRTASGLGLVTNGGHRLVGDVR